MNAPCALEKSVYSAVVGVLSYKFNIVHVDSVVEKHKYLSFCMYGIVLPIAEEVLNLSI